MTAPREVVAGRTYMITSRCAHRRYYLRPNDDVNNAYIYCFALAAQENDIDVYWVSTLSNHEHPGIHDKKGKYPKFLGYFHSLLARCLNKYLGRWENFWATEQRGVLELVDGEAVFDKMVYGLSNAVKAYLVDKVVHWPGVNSLTYQLHDKPMRATRPAWFFDPEGSLPDEVELRLVRPPAFAHLSQEEWADKLRAAIAAEEKKAAKKREKTGRTVVGRKAVLRQSPFACPEGCCERRGINPRIATRNKWLRIERLQRKKKFELVYRHAYVHRRTGDVNVVFPYGTYQLAWQGLVLYVGHPALE